MIDPSTLVRGPTGPERDGPLATLGIAWGFRLERPLTHGRQHGAPARAMAAPVGGPRHLVCHHVENALPDHSLRISFRRSAEASLRSVAERVRESFGARWTALRRPITQTSAVVRQDECSIERVPPMRSKPQSQAEVSIVVDGIVTTGFCGPIRLHTGTAGSAFGRLGVRDVIT